MDAELWGPNVDGTRPTFLHFLFVRVVLQASQRARDARPSCACYSFTFMIRQKACDGSLSSIAISTTPPGKSTQLTLKWCRLPP